MNLSLFQKKTVNNAIRHFIFPEDITVKHNVINKWIKTLEKGTLDEIKEVSLHGQFLNDIFQGILGYLSVIDGQGEKWQIHAESTISDGGGSADGAIGFFTASEGKKGQVKLQGRVIAPIELKGAKNDLDRLAPGRKESAVDQGWRYANYTPDCQWVIVSNYREIRLYNTGKTPAYYEQFRLKDLADLDNFKRFYFLLCRFNFLPLQNKPSVKSKIDILLAESNEAEIEISKQLYQEYKQIRLDLVATFRHQSDLSIAVLIEKAQKTLDRLLFIAFCEDRGLLPKQTINQAHNYRDPYKPRPIWSNYKAVFQWVDKGNNETNIPSYNGGLFTHDEILDEQLSIDDNLCSQMKQLTRFDFDTEVSVDILGRIFEQSVTDLEELRALTQGEKYNTKQGKRKTQGIFYTPAFITQYIVKVALGSYLEKEESKLLKRFSIPEKSSKQQLLAEIKFWETYRDEVLRKTKVIDPACGSGAFLIAAFDYLMGEYQRVNLALAGLKEGQLSVFDLNKTILNNNLYGVDLSPESVEITKLSLWLKTAEPGKTLTSLDENIKVGNSIIADDNLDNQALNWQTSFSDVFAEGGFDVVIGNPPYVRQELLSKFKPYLSENYQSYNGVADLYIYFYEQGLKILKPEGILSYIVTNKWLRAGYGEGLRKFFTEKGILEQIIDFGHAPIFEDAETFPCIIAVRKTEQNYDISSNATVNICAISREKLAEINLPQYIQQEGYQVPLSRFRASGWSLERPEIDELMQKLKNVGIPLRDYAGVKPLYGIKTGFNEAFLIDDETRNKLIEADPKCAEIIKPYLRGQDIKRWSSKWNNLWIIFTRRGINIDNYPSIYKYLSQYREQLEPCPKHTSKENWQGRKSGSYKWYEIQDAVDYWELFLQPKIIYQEINTLPSYALDNNQYFINNKVFLLPKADLYILGCLNSPLGWWIAHRLFPKMIGDAVTPRGDLMISFPIAPPTETIRSEVEEIVSRLIEITKNNQQVYEDVLDWLKIEQNIEKPGTKLENFSNFNCDEFIQEIKKRQPKNNKTLSIATLKAIKEVYNEYCPAIKSLHREALTLENRLSDLVNQAYRLTPEEIHLIWKTAPPKMPINNIVYL